MVPEDGIAVVAGTHDAVLGQPEAGEIGKIAMSHRGRPGGRRREMFRVLPQTTFVTGREGGATLYCSHEAERFWLCY